MRFGGGGCRFVESGRDSATIVNDLWLNSERRTPNNALWRSICRMSGSVLRGSPGTISTQGTGRPRTLRLGRTGGRCLFGQSAASAARSAKTLTLSITSPTYDGTEGQPTGLA
jgi:hypothetical protein